MKLDCDYFNDRRRAKIIRLAEWHKRFAWLPVRIGRNDCRWLETVEARYMHSMYPRWSKWEYRAPR